MFSRRLSQKSDTRQEGCGGVDGREEGGFLCHGTWSKTYEGNNASNHFNRAIDGAVYKVVVAIMGDQDFKNALR